MRKKAFYFITSLLQIIILCNAESITKLILSPPESIWGREDLLGMPFSQAYPFSVGELKIGSDEKLLLRGKSLEGMATVVTRWHDGSVHWLRVNGIITGPVEIDMTCRLYSLKHVAGITELTPSFSLQHVWQSDDIGVYIVGDNYDFYLRPTATMVEITKPMEFMDMLARTDPDYLDEHGQYRWAAEIDSLNDKLNPVSLIMRLRDLTEFDGDSGSRIYRLRGDGSIDALAGHLEWQLRVECFANTPVIKLGMTWKFFWDVEKWALSEATWVISSTEDFGDVEILDGEAMVSANMPFAVGSQPNGSALLVETWSGMVESPNWFTWINRDQQQALAVPNLLKLGPNRVSVENNIMQLESWNGVSGLALDLRQTSNEEEFGIDISDLESRPTGLSRTLDAYLVLGERAMDSQAVAAALADRDNLWFPKSSQVIETAAIGPIHPEVILHGADYFEGLRANLHFLLASREKWNWKGFINYGDVRTNFSLGRNKERGLFPYRWSLYGRYGWRNGSGDVPHGLLMAGLLLDDRELLLMGIDYARHISEVDLSHPSFFELPHQQAGGMHRRNRDHWSGSIQLQYSPSNGIYLASWLTGDNRMYDALASLRDYALRMGGSSSAFGAQAWINRYRETLSPSDLKIAHRLLYNNADGWVRRSPSGKVGIPAIYDGNFRWASDGVSTLIQFHEATGDPQVLDWIHEILNRESEDARRSPNLSFDSVIGYLISSGMNPSELNSRLIQDRREYIQSIQNGPLIPPNNWSYDELLNIITSQLQPPRNATFLESAAIGLRARNAFYALNLLYHPAMMIAD